MNTSSPTPGTAATTVLAGLASAYPRAEVTTAVVHDRRDDLHFVLLAVAELCPPDQPTSPTIGDPRFGMMRERLEGDAFSLYLRRDHVSVAEALSFFRAVDGAYRLPNPCAPPLVSVRPLAAVTRGEEAVLIPSNLAGAVGLGAVLPKRPTAIGTLSKFDNSRSLHERLPEPVIERATTLVRASLSVDLARFPEHVGAVHLCFADPILRGFERSITADEHTLLVRCYERAGCSVIGCELELCNEWPPLGIGFRVRHTIQSPFFNVPLPAPPQSLRVRLFDPSGRCLEDESAAFIRRFALDLAISSRRRVVYVKPDGQTETHDVETVSHERRAQNDPILGPLAYMDYAQKRRELDDLAAARIFVYFPGGDESRRSARDTIRDLLAKARDRCDIVDPYLSGDDVAMFLPFVATKGCRVRLLSSHAFLHERRGESYDTHEVALVDRLHELKDLPFKVECRKLPGHDRSPVHDRLIAVDDNVYLLGSSLSEFGSRATTLARAPDSRLLLTEIGGWWDRAVPLQPATTDGLLVELGRVASHARAAAGATWNAAKLAAERAGRALRRGGTP